MFEAEIIDLEIHSKESKEIPFSKIYFFEDFASYSPDSDVFHNIFDENYGTSEETKDLLKLRKEIKNKGRNRSKLCLDPSCKKIASFNFAYERQRLYCFDHKKIGMVNVSHRKCAASGCNTIPNFNYSDQKSRLFCKIHKKPGMINVSRVKKCRHLTCAKTPCFNFPGEERLLFCNKHKKPGMINLIYTKKKKSKK